MRATIFIALIGIASAPLHTSHFSLRTPHSVLFPYLYWPFALAKKIACASSRDVSPSHVQQMQPRSWTRRSAAPGPFPYVLLVNTVDKYFVAPEEVSALPP